MATQRFVRPLRQWMHWPHSGANSVITWSPGFTRATPSPTASTTPAPSWPSTHGAYPVGSAPEAVYRSVWQTPQAASRTSASPALGSARSTSCTDSGCPNSSRTAARIFTPSECPRRQARVEYLARLLDAADREACGIEQPDLDEHARLVPVDVLVRDLVAVDADHGAKRELDPLPRRWDAGEQPVDLGGVRECDHELVDERRR